ncbi:hypothetical protein CAOG_08577, partial [Capsaspora owczarzaki ATCC 30864]
MVSFGLGIRKSNHKRSVSDSSAAANSSSSSSSTTVSSASTVTAFSSSSRHGTTHMASTSAASIASAAGANSASSMQGVLVERSKSKMNVLDCLHHQRDSPDPHARYVSIGASSTGRSMGARVNSPRATRHDDSALHRSISSSTSSASTASMAST